MQYIKCNHSIAILLATYNSEKFLREQLVSLFSQSYKDWTLYIHDDGSKDATLSIISEYLSSHNNIVLLDFPPTGGAKSNFMQMLSCVEADYYMFCDHDDVWLNTKVEITYNSMNKAEKTFPNCPIIVHSDLFVVDQDLNVLHPSFWKYEGIYPNDIHSFEMLSAFNLATGCTMMINSRAKEVTPCDCKEALMHDSWITAAVLWSKGKVIDIDQPLIYYRQHGDNCLGARQLNVTLVSKLLRLPQIIKDNIRRYRMLNKVGHISAFRFIKYKVIGRKKLLSHIKEENLLT